MLPGLYPNGKAASYPSHQGIQKTVPFISRERVAFSCGMSLVFLLRKRLCLL